MNYCEETKWVRNLEDGENYVLSTETVGCGLRIIVRYWIVLNSKQNISPDVFDKAAKILYR